MDSINISLQASMNELELMVRHYSRYAYANNWTTQKLPEDGHHQVHERTIPIPTTLATPKKCRGITINASLKRPTVVVYHVLPPAYHSYRTCYTSQTHCAFLHLIDASQPSPLSSSTAASPTSAVYPRRRIPSSPSWPYYRSP